MNPSQQQPHLQKQQSQPHAMQQHPQQSSQHHPTQQQQQQQQHRLSNPPSPSNPLYMSSSASPSNRTGAPASIPNSRAYAHGVAFLSACDSFFAGLDNFILQASTPPTNPATNPINPGAASTPSSSSSSAGNNNTAAANEEMAITKLYQKYMQLEVETDSLAIYLAEEERKLLLELQEPQVHMSQIHSEQLKYLQGQQALQQPDIQVPPLSNKSALVRAQYELYKKRAQADPAGSGISQVPTATTPATHNSSAQPPLSSSAGVNPPSSTGGAPRTPHSAPHSVPSPSSFPAGMVVLSPAQVLTPNNPATGATNGNAPMES